MLSQVLPFALLCFGCVLAGDEYKARYQASKASVRDLLLVDAGQSKCRFVRELEVLVNGCNCGITATQSSAFTSWLHNIEVSIVADASLSVEAKLMAISVEVLALQKTQADLYLKMGYLSFGNWGVLSDLVPIAAELSFDASFQLVAVRADGGCALFDKLIAAAQATNNAALVADLQAFIESDLKVIVGDKSKGSADILVAIYAALDAKFFVQKPQYRAIVLGLKLVGFGGFNVFWQASLLYQQQITVTTTLAGEGFDCPLILAFNASLQDASFTLSQKGQIKQFMNYLMQQFTVDMSLEVRMQIVSAKFVEFINMNPSFFSLFARIQIQGFGSFYQLIICTCVNGNLPTPAPVTPAIPTASPAPATTTPELELTTLEAAITTESVTEVTTDITERVTEEVTEEVTEGITEAITEAVTEEVTEGVTESVTEQATTEAELEFTTEAETEFVTDASTAFSLPSTSGTTQCSCVCE